MWTTVYVALGRKKAQHIEDITREEGFYVKKKHVAKEGNTEIFEIITLESEAEELYEFLIERDLI